MPAAQSRCQILLMSYGHYAYLISGIRVKQTLSYTLAALINRSVSSCGDTFIMSGRYRLSFSKWCKTAGLIVSKKRLSTHDITCAFWVESKPDPSKLIAFQPAVLFFFISYFSYFFVKPWTKPGSAFLIAPQRIVWNKVKSPHKLSEGVMIFLHLLLILCRYPSLEFS